MGDIIIYPPCAIIFTVIIITLLASSAVIAGEGVDTTTQLKSKSKGKRGSISFSFSFSSPAATGTGTGNTNLFRSEEDQEKKEKQMASLTMATSSSLRLRVSETEDDVAVALAKYIADISNNHTQSNPDAAFTVVLSGGYLINSLRKLTEAPYLESVDWSKWHVFWLDERVVPLDHPDSNYNLAFDGFLSKTPIPPDQIYAINDTLVSSPSAAADDYESRIKHLVAAGVVPTSPATGFPRFHLQLLGMGPDGHIASLFPRHPLLHEKERWVTFIEDSPKPPPRRITFTFPVIDASAYIAMVVVGGGEVDALAKALGNNNNQTETDPCSHLMMPVQMINLQDGEFTWFCDKQALSNLDNPPSPSPSS